MAQADRDEVLSKKLGSLFEQVSNNKNVATTSSYVTLLDIDCRAVSESVFVIHNVTAGDLDYKIIANAEDIRSIVAPTGTDDDDKGWVVLKIGSVASGAVPAVETLGNPYSKIILQIKHTTATTNASAWHRGEG